MVHESKRKAPCPCSPIASAATVSAPKPTVAFRQPHFCLCLNLLTCLSTDRPKPHHTSPPHAPRSYRRTIGDIPLTPACFFSSVSLNPVIIDQHPVWSREGTGTVKSIKTDHFRSNPSKPIISDQNRLFRSFPIKTTRMFTFVRRRHRHTLRLR